MMTLNQARESKSNFLHQYLRTERSPYVNGIGITQILPQGESEREYAIKVNLREPLPAGLELPAKFEGMHVITEVIGQVIAQSSPSS